MTYLPGLAPAQAGACKWCRAPLPGRGQYCSTAHRVAAFRERERYSLDGLEAVTAAGEGNDDVGLTRAAAGRGRNTAGVVTGPDADRYKVQVTETVAALYVRADGHYSTMPDVDPWPEGRDAALYAGPHPVVAHPPCAPWGRYRTIAPTRQRADLAVRAVDQVRWYGGVLEQPAASHLWLARDLPAPGVKPDQWGGWSMLIRQSWWGHRAPKPTWLYVVGRPVGDTPPPAATRSGPWRPHRTDVPQGTRDYAARAGGVAGRPCTRLPAVGASTVPGAAP